MTVHFVGAGPGAADLITVRAQRLLSECSVCLYAGSLVPAEVLALCPTGARLVANAVTIEGQAVLAGWRQRRGGTLTRIGVERAGGLGTLTTWRPALPVVQWSMHKKESP